jgi:hypothetical protein
VRAALATLVLVAETPDMIDGRRRHDLAPAQSAPTFDSTD